MRFLVSRFVVRHLVRDWFRTVLSLLGVLLGVALYCAIRIVNTSVLAAFAVTVDAIAGRANLVVSSSPPGLDERWFPLIERTPGVIAAAPVIEAYLPLLGGGARGGGRSHSVKELLPGAAPSVLVLGVDPIRQKNFILQNQSEAAPAMLPRFLTDPSAAGISEQLARQHRLKTGDSVHVLSGSKPITLRVLGILPSQPLSGAYGGNLLVMDIAAAQEQLGRSGRLDHVLLWVDPSRVGAVREVLRRRLPASVEVQPPASRTTAIDKMLGAFQLNLEALSLIALFVSAFLIYNTFSAMVVRRRRELGLLFSLGVTRPEVILLVLIEAAILGAAGSGAGLVAGYWLARGMMSAIAATVSILYMQVLVRDVSAPGAVLGASMALGMAASLCAALAPAIEAGAVDPVRVLRQGAQIRFSRMRWLLFAAGSVVLMLLGAIFSLLARRLNAASLTLAAAFCILACSSLTSPFLSKLAARLVGAASCRLPGFVLRTAAASMGASVERVWVVVGALAAAVSMLVGLTVMITSFRRTVDRWTDQIVIGDVFVSPAAGAVSGAAATLTPAAVRIASSLSTLRGFETFRQTSVRLDGVEIALTARDFGIHSRRSFPLTQVNRKIDRPDSILVSGPLAERLNLSAGESFKLPTPEGWLSLPIGGVFEDFTSETGVILIPRSIYVRYWRDDSVDSIGLYARQGVSAGKLAQQEAEALARWRVLVRTNSELHADILNVFDQTFRITGVLELVSMVIAVLGVAGALTTMVMQRWRDLALLRAIGADPATLAAVILMEAALIALSAWSLGALTGLVLAYHLIHAVLPAYFHWTVEASYRFGAVLVPLALVLPAALIAALPPAVMAARSGLSGALRSE